MHPLYEDQRTTRLISQYIRAHARALRFTTPESMPAEPVTWLCTICPQDLQRELIVMLMPLQWRGATPTQCARYTLDPERYRLPFEEAERERFDAWILEMLDLDCPPLIIAKLTELHGVMVDGFIRLYGHPSALVVDAEVDRSGGIHV